MEGHDNPPVPKDDSLHFSALAQCESARAKEDVPLLMRRHPRFVSNPLAAVPFILDILESSRAFYSEKNAAGGGRPSPAIRPGTRLRLRLLMTGTGWIGYGGPVVMPLTPAGPFVSGRRIHVRLAMDRGADSAGRGARAEDSVEEVGPYLSERQCSETCRPHPGPLPEGEGEVFSVNLMMGFLVPIRR